MKIYHYRLRSLDGETWQFFEREVDDVVEGPLGYIAKDNVYSYGMVFSESPGLWEARVSSLMSIPDAESKLASYIKSELMQMAVAYVTKIQSLVESVESHI